MISAPPPLTIRRRFVRPDRTTIDAFKGVPISVIADAQRGKGGLNHRIQPLDPNSRLIGPALTAWCAAGDNLGALAALELARAGDVIVIACAGYDGVGVIGDRFAGMARNRRLGGIVVDGLVRDRPGILAAGVPCYARGANASSAYSLGPGEAGLPIAIGGIVIKSGDLVIGDGDGIVIVPQSAFAEVTVALAEVKQNETGLDEAVASGATGFKWVRDLMRSSKVHKVR